MEGSSKKHQKDEAKSGKGIWTLVGAVIAFVITALGNVATCRKTEAERENLLAQTQKLREEVRASQAGAAKIASQIAQSWHDGRESEERSARAWLELIRASPNLEDRILALKWLYESTPYASAKKAAQEELKRIWEGEDGERLNRESERLKKGSARGAGGHKLQRVEQSQKVFWDLFGSVRPVLGKSSP